MDIIIGQYIPNDTIIHKLDPRVKIIGLTILMASIFMNLGWQANLFLALFTLFILWLSKTSIKLWLATLKPLLFMFVILLVLNAWVVKTGVPIWTIEKWNFVVYSGAVLQTGYILMRIVLIVTLSIVLTSATDPLTLTLGLEKLMKPLNKLKVPVSIFAMMISIALRFVPTLVQETQKIMKAQASRGLDFENGNFKTKIKAIIVLIIPLLVISFNKADDLALAMEARNYDPDSIRPRYRQLKLRYYDYITTALLVMMFVLLVFAKYKFK